MSSFPDRSVHNTRGSRRPSLRTQRIVQYLASTNLPVKASEIASFLKAPYNSVHRTLRRLVKTGRVKEDSKRFFELNHEAFNHDPGLFSTYTGEVSMLQVHRLGLRAVVPGLADHVVAAGRCLPWEWRPGEQPRPRSLVFGADLRLFSDKAYYTRSSEPVTLRNVTLFCEDFLRSLSFYTKGQASVSGIDLTDFELGCEAPDLFYEEPSRVILYRKHGRVRIHIQHAGENEPAPLTQPQKIQLLHKYRRGLEDTIVTLTEAWISTCKELGGVWTPKQA